MNVPARLAAYGVGLVALFGVGLGAGALLESDDNPAPAKPTGPTTTVDVPTTQGGTGHGHQ